MANTKRTFPVQGMGCAACVARVEGALKNARGVNSCQVSLASNTALVDYDNTVTSPGELRKAVQDAGYDMIVDGTDDEAHSRAEAEAEESLRALRKDTIIAVALAALVMVISMGFRDFSFKGYLLWALATPVVFWCGRRFFKAGILSLRHGSANMDTLFNLLFPSVWTSRGLEPHLYFESSTMIVAFILLGRLLEERAKHSTTKAIRGLMELQPPKDPVLPGEVVVVKPGERLPIDGLVIDGSSYVDESMLTGESAHVLKKAGDRVYSGTMNQRGFLNVKAEKVGEETMLSSIIRMVRDAQGTKAPVQKLVDRIAAVFVPVIIGISVLTLIAWIIFGGGDGVTLGLLSMVAVLVVACPCSLGLATPTAIIAGIGNGASKGILIKDAESLQTAAKVQVVVMDKTGTLTDGTPEDNLRESSVQAVKDLQKMGLEVHVVSGDKEDRVRRIADATGITHVTFGVLPDGKAGYVSRLQESGKKVAMIGDGINDSAALALADLSIAMGTGTDIAMDAAQVTIVSSDLTKVSDLVKLSKRAVKIIRENLFWAFFYNVAAVPIAAGLLYPFTGWLMSPMLAAACMALSSICVVSNSLRLLH